MIQYTPDKWVNLKFTDEHGESCVKVLAGWYGGFGGTNSWKLNSGVTKVERLSDTETLITGHTGSMYMLHKGAYGLSSLTASILSSFEKVLGEGQTLEVLSYEDSFTI